MGKKTSVPTPTDERHDLAALPLPAVDPGTALGAANGSLDHEPIFLAACVQRKPGGKSAL